MEQAILDQLIKLSGEFGSFKTEMRTSLDMVKNDLTEKIERVKTELTQKMESGFKAQDEKIEGVRTELTQKMEKGFKEQRELSEKNRKDLLWNMEDASIIIKDVYNCLNNKIDCNYFELRKKAE